MSLPSEVRVLHVTAVPSTGAVLVAPIARRQTECGYQVEFASGIGEQLDKLYQLGFPVTVVSMTRRLFSWSHVVAGYQLWHLMRDRQYHVVHTHTPIASLLGRIAATLARVPCVIYHMRVSWWESPDAGWFTKLAFTAVEWSAAHLLRTDHIFTLNVSDEKHLIARKIVLPGQVTCLHCGAGGVDTQRFDPAHITEEQRQQLKTELGLEDSDFVIGFIGRIVHRKGVIELVSAFARVLRQFPRAKLLLIGGVLESERDQITLQKVKEMISNNGDLARSVVITGFRDDTPRLIAIMDVLVLPSRLEPFGMVIAEAAAMAKPVIATNTQGGREAVIPGETGLLVPIGNIEALGDAILQLASDPELREGMGKAGRRLALESFDERRIFEKIQQVYLRLLEEKEL